MHIPLQESCYKNTFGRQGLKTSNYLKKTKQMPNVTWEWFLPCFFFFSPDFSQAFMEVEVPHFELATPN